MKKPKHVVTDEYIQTVRRFADEDIQMARKRAPDGAALSEPPQNPMSYDKLVSLLSIAFECSPRTAYFMALMTIGNYLCSNAAAHLGSRFLTLAIELNDLDAGIVAPLLRPAHVENRAGDSSVVWIKRAHVALGIEALIEAGFSRKNAARVAVEHENVRHFIGASNAVPEKVALSWRDEFSKGRVKNSTGAGTYGACCAQISQFASEWGAKTSTLMIQLAKSYFSHV